MVFRANRCTYRLTGLDYYHYYTIITPSSLHWPFTSRSLQHLCPCRGEVPETKIPPRGHAGTSQMVSKLHHHYLSSSSPPTDDASPRHLSAADPSARKPAGGGGGGGGYAAHEEEHPETFARSISGQTVKYNHRHHYEMKRGGNACGISAKSSELKICGLVARGL